MESLYRLTEHVKTILEQDKRARNSDSYLYLKVIEDQAKMKPMDIKKTSLSDFLLHSAEWGFSSFESVRRTRQKAQEKFPLLRACESVEAARAENETEYREFARSV